MGMMDALERFDAHFQIGQEFTLQDARLGPAITTQYGADQPAQYKIDGKWYSVFGVALANQISRMDDEDRASMRNGTFRCKMVLDRTRAGNDVKMLVPPDWEPEAQF